MRAATAKVDMKVSILDGKKQENQCDKVTIKPPTMRELPSHESVTADGDRGSEDNTTTYEEPVNQWPTTTMQRGSAIIGSAKNVVIRAAKLSDLRWANVFVSRLDPDLIAVDLKSYLDSSLNLDVALEQVKSTTTYSSFTLRSTAHFRKYSYRHCCGKRFDGGGTTPVTTSERAVTMMPNHRLLAGLGALLQTLSNENYLL